ncbi:MAG: protein kinase domain-containing protein [Pyrinomonadaceae bacterium]
MRPSPKTIFGHYKIISQLGAGGMGEVFLAEDTGLGRKVALKLLAEKFTANSDQLNRFVREAKSASALNHPNIITVYEIGEWEGANFIATEYIEGETLRDVLEKGGSSLDEALSIVIQTAEALSAAHAAGIVHRDIKPENIMLRSDGYVKILDFGLAKLTKKSEAEPEEVTQKLVKTNPGVVMGTVSYMSPEQARGRAVDARTDIFSLGVVLYEMLAGRLPFAGESIADILVAILHNETPSLFTYRQDTPPELERIVAKTLRKNKDERYRSAKDLLTDLKSLQKRLNFEAELERSSSPNKQAEEAEDKTRIFKVAIAEEKPGLLPDVTLNNKDALLLTEFHNLTNDAVFDATLKMALAFCLEQSPYLEIYADARVRQTLRLMEYSADERVTRRLGREICQRQGLKAYIAGTISSMGSVYVLTLEALNAQTGETIGRQLEQAESKEQVLKALGQAASRLREKLGESLSSIERFDAALEMTTSSLEALKVHALGQEQTQKGKTLGAIPFYKRAIELDPNFAFAYNLLAVQYNNANQPKLAAEYAAKAFELRERVSELEKLRITAFYYSYVTGELDKRIETLELIKKTYPHDIRAVNNLSDSYQRIGQFEKAVDAAREGVRLNPNTFASYANLAESLLRRNRFTEAKEVCERAFKQKFDSTYFHIYLYEIAFIESDPATMAQHLAWFSGQRDEYVVLNLQTSTAAYQGRRRKSQDFSRRAIDLAVRSDAKAVAAQYAAEQALRIVFWSSGTGLPSPNDNQLKLALKTQTQKALGLERNKVTLTRATLALAIAGQTSEADKPIEELKTEYPKDTLVHGLWLPLIKAALRLQSGKAKEAIEELETAERFERAAEFYPQYIRGLAYLKLNKMKQASAEFKKILNHRGEAALSSIYPFIL